MNLYDRITKDVVLRSEYDAMKVRYENAEKRWDQLDAMYNEKCDELEKVKRDHAFLTESYKSVEMGKEQLKEMYDDLAALCFRLVNTKFEYEQDNGECNHYLELTHFHVVRKKDGKIVANLLSLTPMNTAHTRCVPADQNPDLMVGDTVRMENA